MAIIAFWSDEKRETGQTLSMVALSTYMAIEHNYKILNVGTDFKDNTLEDCYWNSTKVSSLVKSITETNGSMIGLESGIEGLIQVIRSNRTASSILSNYSRVIFKDRLDALCSPKVTEYREYKEIAQMYPEVLNIANRTYDMVFVDVSKKMDAEDANRILEMADVVIVNITQRLSIINKFLELREGNQFFRNDKIILNIGRYDGFSKYNVKNISRYLKLKRDICAVPYNTLFFESCSEGKVAEYFLKLRNISTDDRNYVFTNDISKICNELIYKIKELKINA